MNMENNDSKFIENVFFPATNVQTGRFGILTSSGGQQGRGMVPLDDDAPYFSLRGSQPEKKKHVVIGSMNQRYTEENLTIKSDKMALTQMQDQRIALNKVMEEALKEMEQAMATLGTEGSGKTIDDIFMESMEHWRHFQLKMMDLGDDSTLRDEATSQFKVKLYSAWMSEIMGRIEQYNPESARALEFMQKVHRILFSGSAVASFAEEGRMIENKSAESQGFDQQMEDVQHLPDHNRFISVAPKNDKDSDMKKFYSSARDRKFGRIKELLKYYVPITDWGSQYQLSWLKGDIIAGLSIGIMVIPQGMAYSLLAGLPPEYGLYSAFIPPLIYMIFGSSAYMAISSEAISSLLIGEAIQELAGDDPEHRIEISNLMGLMAGIFLFLFGFFQFGFILNFLSRPVLSGFTSAAAVVIACNQLKHVFGIQMDNSPLLPKLMKDFFENIEDINWISAAIAVGSLAILIFLKKFPNIPKTTIPIPGALIVVVLGTGLVAAAKLDVKYVGSIPKGLPSPRVPHWDSGSFVELIQPTILIALVGFMESISVAKILAARHKQQLRENQEFIGLGFANIVGCFFRTYPTAGALGRTAVCEGVGGKTQLSGLISVAVVTITLLFLTPLFYYLPNAVLAAVIWVAVIPLIEYHEAAFLWASNKRELVLLLMSFLLTLIFGVEVGILVSVGADIILIIYMASRPNTEVLGRLPGTIIYRNIEKYPEALTTPGVVIFRFDASLFFGNCGYLHDKLNRIRAVLREFKHTHPNGKASLVFVCDSVAHIDTTSIVGLSEIVQEYINDDIFFCFAGLQGSAMLAVQSSGLVNAVGPDNFYYRVHDAVNACIGSQILRNVPELFVREKWMHDRVHQAFTIPPNVRRYIGLVFPFMARRWKQQHDDHVNLHDVDVQDVHISTDKDEVTTEHVEDVLTTSAQNSGDPRRDLD